MPKDISEQVESQTITWRLELPGNVKDVGIMRIYTAQRDFVGLAPLVTVRTVSVSKENVDFALNISFSEHAYCPHTTHVLSE